MGEKIIIIGAGVSGITTAFVLQMLGYSTQIYTAEQPLHLNKQGDPAFASLYPSASIIPHSVFSDQLESLFKESQSFFYKLLEKSFPGLSVHNHFEVFEFDKEPPEYLEWMKNPQFIDELNSNSIPRLSDGINLYGWSFDCIFADWPIYFPALINRYQEAGGEIIIRKVKAKDIGKLPASTIINCTGIGGHYLFDDQKEPALMRGHLLHLKDMPLITDSENTIVSYNYTPEASVYCDAAGEACDVYCYPRKDGWIIGGSRQSGTLDESGQWKGEETKAPFYERGNTRFPAQVIDLNKKIIEHSFGISVNEKNLTPLEAFRYIRSKNNGLRLDKENAFGKKIYHNYGHGGAGVTLSWGCALNITAEIDQQNPKQIQKKLLNQL